MASDEGDFPFERARIAKENKGWKRLPIRPPNEAMGLPFRGRGGGPVGGKTELQEIRKAAIKSTQAKSSQDPTGAWDATQGPLVYDSSEAVESEWATVTEMVHAPVPEAGTVASLIAVLQTYPPDFLVVMVHPERGEWSGVAADLMTFTVAQMGGQVAKVDGVLVHPE